MPLAASNALRNPIVVFTSMLNFTVLPVMPREIVLSENLIFLVYDMNYAGHYDAVDSIPQLTMAQEVCQPLSTQNTAPSRSESVPLVSCRCGQGAKRKKEGSMSCHEYRSGCKCFQNVLGCNDNCQCINCCNPPREKSKHQPTNCTNSVTKTETSREHNTSSKWEIVFRTEGRGDNSGGALDFPFKMSEILGRS